MSVRVIPLSEHDSYYCLDDVEIWEVSFSSLSSEDLEFVEGGGGASKISNNYISCIQPNCKQTNALSRADSPATTDITAASLNTDSSILKDVRKKNVEMLSWGSALVVTARLLDEVVEIRQNFDRGGTGCFLWASSVILSRLILSEEFDQEIMSMFNPTSFIKTKSPFKPSAVDLG